MIDNFMAMIPCGVHAPLGVVVSAFGSYWWFASNRKRRKADRFEIRSWQLVHPVLWVPAWIIYVLIYFNVVWKQVLVIAAGYVFWLYGNLDG